MAKFRKLTDKEAVNIEGGIGGKGNSSMPDRKYIGDYCGCPNSAECNIVRNVPPEGRICGCCGGYL